MGVALTRSALATFALTSSAGKNDARGYARSEIAESHVHVLCETTALVSVSRVRRSVTDRELERLGETYTLRRTGDDWKIVVASCTMQMVCLRAAAADGLQ